MIFRTYDSWKAHNPDDEFLGPEPEPENEWPSDEEIGRREHFGRYDELPDVNEEPPF